MVKVVEKEFGKKESIKFEFIATSFVLPQDHGLFHEEFRKTGGIWIMKPVGKAQGKGIFLINKMSQISSWKKDPRLRPFNEDGPEAYIVQRYIENPYLIGGKKFDMRIYVLVTSFNPLVVYIHRNGFCRFSNSQFSMNSKDISNLCNSRYNSRHPRNKCSNPEKCSQLRQRKGMQMVSQEFKNFFDD